MLFLLFPVLLNGCHSYDQDSALATADSYLGQIPPGSTPELFAPEIIQTEFREGEAAISSDLKTFYFRRRGGEYESNTLVAVQYQDGQWVESVLGESMGEPFISPDGTVLHLGKRYMERVETGWSKIRNLGAPLENIRIMRLTASSNGTYYFDEITEGGNISYSRLINGEREEPKTLTNDIDMGVYRAHPYIAPDESYLIWDDQRENGFGGADLYISFRQQDNSWGAAINLGEEINTEFEEAYGSVSPDGKYFFFHRAYGGDRGDIFWVDAQFIETLRPK